MTMFQRSRNSSSRSLARRPAYSRRKRYGWFNSSANLTTTGLATNQVVLLNQGDLGDYTEPTLVRSRGEVVVSVPAVASGSYFWIAMMVVQLDELGNPPLVNIFDQERSSLFWAYEGWVEDFGGGHRYVRIDVDSKSKRRIEGDEGVVLYVQQITGGTTLTFRYAGRFLVQQV